MTKPEYLELMDTIFSYKVDILFFQEYTKDPTKLKHTSLSSPNHTIVRSVDFFWRTNLHITITESGRKEGELFFVIFYMVPLEKAREIWLGLIELGFFSESSK
jgi:hypothetical protein